MMNELQAAIRRIVEANTDDFFELLSLAGLDPNEDIDGLDPSAIAFGGVYRPHINAGPEGFRSTESSKKSRNSSGVAQGRVPKDERVTDIPANGIRREIDGEIRVYYDGYWIKHYDPPPDTPEARKDLIQALTRRLFNHVEHGINIPGVRLDEARAAYQAETDPERKRVNGAMLAGALFNRAADIFTSVVELQASGITINPDDTLMRECGQCLLEALDLGKVVRDRSGDEGIDELWGDPFRAFSVPIEAFYESRYVKIAMAMRDIDRIGAGLKDAFSQSSQIANIGPRIDRLAKAAKRKCEILRTDPKIFDVWPEFVVAQERLCDIQPRLSSPPDTAAIRAALDGTRLLRDGTELVMHIVRARVPMPKRTREFLDKCSRYSALHSDPAQKVGSK